VARKREKGTRKRSRKLCSASMERTSFSNGTRCSGNSWMSTNPQTPWRVEMPQRHNGRYDIKSEKDGRELVVGGEAAAHLLFEDAIAHDVAMRDEHDREVLLVVGRRSAPGRPS
jgi:hypothetical protein